ncbi:ABC transporter substrate-binding protein [Nonomuraea soli]|uniref:Multiple sugar transport system substrate-binding protein n=1 Tax=Nonomuraea soli TaxID=1032476 RepID=A0A7W0HS15_9ACTN|nr:sugar ABC transporter substrate-binding protein [Nonomuraea soli]MBA2893201.1 multiple sugar transport system substrate-binding protein [Nonomuraea soli]
MGRTLAVAAALAGMSLLAACGGESAAPAAAPAGQPATVTFWGWAKGTQQVVDAFNKSHKDIQIKFEEIPSGNAGGYAKFANAVKAGNAPDVMSIEYPQLPDFVNQGALQDITAEIGDVKSKYPANVFSLVELGGKAWSLPMDAAPQVFFYRKDLFEANKIDVPKTWDDFRAAAEKVKKADDKARIATFFPDDPSVLTALSWQAGAKWFGTEGDAWKVSINDEATKKVADYWQGLVKDDLVKVQASFSQEWNAAFEDNSLWGYVGANWGAGVMKGNHAGQAGKWAIAPAPNWGTPASGMLGGTTFGVSANSKNTKASVEVIKWLTGSEEAWTSRLSSGTSSGFPAIPDLVPVAQKSFDASFYGGQDIYALFTEAYGSIQPGWTWGPSMVQVLTAFKDSLGKVSTGGTTIPEVLESVQQATVAEIKGRGLNVAA